MLNPVYRESSKSMKIKRETRIIPKPSGHAERETSAPRNIHDLSQTPDQQNEISLDLDMQIQGSQKTPNECVK